MIANLNIFTSLRAAMAEMFWIHVIDHSFRRSTPVLSSSSPSMVLTAQSRRGGSWSEELNFSSPFI